MFETFFPFFLLFFCIPLGSIMDDGTFWLRLLATKLTFFVSHTLLGVPLARDGTTLTTPGGSAFEVIAACSGLHSFTALLVVTIIYAMTSLRRFWKRILIVSVTVPLAIGCNVLRLSAMVVAHRAFGARAGEFVHDTDWIITYGVAIVVIMLMGHWLRERNAAPPPEKMARLEPLEA
jgi:exosortase